MIYAVPFDSYRFRSFERFVVVVACFFHHEIINFTWTRHVLIRHDKKKQATNGATITTTKKEDHNQQSQINTKCCQ